MVLLELGSKIKNAIDKFTSNITTEDKDLKEFLNELSRALLQADVSFKLIKQIKTNIEMQFKLHNNQGANIKKLMQRFVVEELTKILETEKKPFQPVKGKTNIIMFVGLQGSGKTTTCAKYAYYWIRKNFKTCMICADTFRAGAFDQLKQNATKIRAPYYGSYYETDPVQIAKEGVDIFKKEGFEIIIVDTSGRHKQADDLFSEMKEMEDAINPNEVIFIMDSSIGQACYDQALAFKKSVKVCSVIVTKLDSGNKKGGGALSAVAATQSPITFIGTGEHFTNIEPFKANSFIKRLLGLGDMEGLINIVKDVVSEDNQKLLIQKMQKGKFNIGDLKIQYQSALKLGPVNNIASMIPGLGQKLMGTGGSEQENMSRIKRFINIIDSMTFKEKECLVKINESRILRIARGSGTSIEEVNILLMNYKQINTMIQKFSKLNLGNESSSNLLKNPQMQQKLMNSLDKNLLNQIGGMGNLMDMVKGFGDMEKNGEMKELNKMLNFNKNKRR